MGGCKSVSRRTKDPGQSISSRPVLVIHGGCSSLRPIPSGEQSPSVNANQVCYFDVRAKGKGKGSGVNLHSLPHSTKVTPWEQNNEQQSQARMNGNNESEENLIFTEVSMSNARQSSSKVPQCSCTIQPQERAGPTHHDPNPTCLSSNQSSPLH